MPYQVEEPTIELHDENKFYFGDLVDIIEEEGQYGPQLKWVMVLDVDRDAWTNDDGTTEDRETWTWCGQKLTTHENNKFRKYAKGLLGEEPQVGELFDERHYTRKFYEDNPDKEPKELTGREAPWRIAVMFNHAKKKDGTPTEKVEILVSEQQVKEG